MRLLLAEEGLRLEVEAGKRAPRFLACFLRGAEEDTRAGSGERDVEEAALLLERSACFLGLVAGTFSGTYGLVRRLKIFWPPSPLFEVTLRSIWATAARYRATTASGT